MAHDTTKSRRLSEDYKKEKKGIKIAVACFDYEQNREGRGEILLVINIPAILNIKACLDENIKRKLK